MQVCIVFPQPRKTKSLYPCPFSGQYLTSYIEARQGWRSVICVQITWKMSLVMQSIPPIAEAPHQRTPTGIKTRGQQTGSSHGRAINGYLPEETGAVQLGRDGCWRGTGTLEGPPAVCRPSPILFLHHMAAARFSNSTPSFPRHSPFPFPRRVAARDSTNLISLYYAVCQSCLPVP